MAITPTTTIRIDPELKRLATEVFDEIGISMSAAITTFLKAAVREGTMPFEIKKSDEGKVAGHRNATLNHAYVVKKDEFYTQYDDIVQEVMRHKKAFFGKKVLCNCDDPFESSFFKFFVLNFERLGLAELVATCYAGSSLAGREYPLEYVSGAYKAIVAQVPVDPIEQPDGSLDLEALFALPENSLVNLEGDGDFRSAECRALLAEADIVVTNPPFSLFREYISQLVSEGKKFLILGNMNAATCREVFPLFRDNLVWYGESIRSGDRKFYVPEGYPLNAANCGIDENGRRFIRVKGVRWFTNLDTARRHTPIELTRIFNKRDYPSYENYDAIEISRTQDIPVNYKGLMGVPITFLDKYSPDQFEIVMLANGNARTNVPAKTLKAVKYRRHPEDRGGVGIIGGRRVYARILIREKSS